jgi:hypothetical protein
MHSESRRGGHYLSEDGGETFTASNKGVGAASRRSVSGVRPVRPQDRGAPDAPGRFYMQNHVAGSPSGPGIGVLRSDDHGRTWRSIAKGLPSDFGFPIVVHPHDADTVYDGAARTNDTARARAARRRCGAARTAATRGSASPRGCRKQESFFTILRDAMTIDSLKSPALYLGTTTGQVWMGRDGGEEWTCLFDSLPPVNNVKVAVVVTTRARLDARNDTASHMAKRAPPGDNRRSPRGRAPWRPTSSTTITSVCRSARTLSLKRSTACTGCLRSSCIRQSRQPATPSSSGS